MRNSPSSADSVMKWRYSTVARDEGGAYTNIVVNIYLRILYKQKVKYN